MVQLRLYGCDACELHLKRLLNHRDRVFEPREAVSVGGGA